MSHGFLQRRIVQPIVNLLRQGTTPEEIALSIAFGLVLGIFPSLGWTTLLCLLATVMFGLNLPSVQLVNYFAYPLQLALLVPFIRAGELLFHSTRLPLSLTQILAMIKADVWHAINVLWIATVQAIAVWVLIAPLAIYILYRVLSLALRRVALEAGLYRAPGGTEAC
jgi:uncharacterized protein (DUF2062 family)